MHGQLNRARCERECGQPPIADTTIYPTLAAVPHCSCGGRLRPHIVFFGETPLDMDRIQDEIAQSTLMLVVGTSGSVYPAAGFVHWARAAGARTLYIGPEPPLNAAAFTHIIQGRAGETLPTLFTVET
jgi:NAD-dependent deacetylase